MFGGVIHFGFFVTIGDFFRPWGWGYCRFDWGSHVVIINNAPWRRTWINRHEYVHPSGVRRYGVGERIPERHVLHERTERDRTAAPEGRPRVGEANLLSGQRVLEDALKTGRDDKEGKGGGLERGHLCLRSPSQRYQFVFRFHT